MIEILTAILFIQQLGDWYSTRTILNKGGVEQNPVMAKIFSVLGLDTALILKGLITTGVGYFVGTQFIYALVGLIVLYVWVLYHNWKSL